MIIMSREGAEEAEERERGTGVVDRKVELVASESVRAIARILSDDYCRRILAAAQAQPRSVEEMSRENSIPLSTCYRRVSGMVDEGVIVVERTVVTQEGKRCDLYRSAFRSLTLRLEGEIMWAVGTINGDVEEKVRSARLGRWARFPGRELDWSREPAPTV